MGRRRERVDPRSGFGSASSGEAFPPVEVPAEVLAAARRESDGLAGVAVVEVFLREVHGPEPDHRDDRERWLAWVGAVEERALGLLEDGAIV